MGTIAKQAANVRLEQARPQDGIAQMIQHNWPRIAAVLPRHMSPERMMQIAISSVNQTPKLALCSGVSLMSCLMRASSLGLEPSAVNGLGDCYIIPRNNRKTGMEATFMLGYKGMLRLARNSGEIESISARCVHEGDFFEYEFGLHEDLRHKPTEDSKEGAENVTHAYCVARFKDGGYHIEVMTRKEIEAARKFSQSGKEGPWATHFEEMAKKTVIRRASKMWPLTSEKSEALRVAAATDETTGGFEGVFEPQIFAAPEAEAEDAAPEVEVEAVEPAAEPTAQRMAACKACGAVVPVAPDATAADMQGVACEKCGASDWDL